MVAAEREHPIRVRIGLNAGEVLQGGGDELFGAAINLAARVMDRADGGEILTADTVHQLVGTMTGATFRDRGRVALKGFAERQGLWEVRPAETRPATPAARRTPRRSHRTRIAAGAVVLAAAAAATVALLDGGSGSAGAVAVAQGNTVWAAANGLMRIDYDPVAGRSRVTWGGSLPAPWAMALGYGSLWGIDPTSERVMRIDPRVGRRTREVRPGSDPTAIASGEGAVWVANTGDNSVSRIDPKPNLVAQTIGVGQGPAAIATGAGAVWVALADAGAVAKIDPRTNHVTATIRVGHRPQGIVVAGGVVWVSVRS